MIDILQSDHFERWLNDLRDPVGSKAVRRRIARVQIGLFGDAKFVGQGVFELRVDSGPGYRVYFARRGDVVVLLLCGGDKGSQSRDIAHARRLAEEWNR